MKKESAFVMADGTRCFRGFPASSNGFSKYSDKKLWYRTQPPDIRHPGSNRAFRNIPVPKLLFYGWNTKKMLFDCTGNPRKHLVPSNLINCHCLITGHNLPIFYPNSDTDFWPRWENIAGVSPGNSEPVLSSPAFVWKL